MESRTIGWVAGVALLVFVTLPVAAEEQADRVEALEEQAAEMSAELEALREELSVVRT